jgi:dTDP-4-dehydrorhamnose 3,5-epimerase
MDFKIKESEDINGIYVITPSISEDVRGNIWSSFVKDTIEKLLPANLSFTHDKFSTSKKNVLRGIHGDKKSWKLVTCVFGEIQQVVVDLRKDSPTYKKWQSFTINRESQKLILLPPSIGNAYYVISQEAVYHYKYAYHGEYIDVNEQFTIKWNDKELGIDWFASKPILSKRDDKL